MDRQIWCYPLRLDPSQKIEVMKEAALLQVGTLDGQLSLWAMVDKNEPIVYRRIYVVKDRDTFQLFKFMYYIGSARVGASVYHVFDGGEE